MRRIYISFLGAGDYKKTQYCFNGKTAPSTTYVQAAELTLFGTGYFDKIFLVMTETSRNKHFEMLKDELSAAGITSVYSIGITEELGPEHHWSWFENILSCIDHGDELTVDLTHGYRIIPIVFSTALNFLQKAKNISIHSVLYGAFEKDNDNSPIVDLKAFYAINEWTDAVSRLIEDADPGKLARVAEKDTSGTLKEFEDPELINAFDSLTASLKNVDVHNVRKMAEHAIELINTKESAASVTGKILLQLVKEKFVSLVSGEPASGRYDANYFSMQLAIIKLLIEHKLFMQAYTVMREFIGSLGLIEMNAKARIGNKKGRNQRQKAEVFVNMLQNAEAQWNFKGDKKRMQESLMPIYEKFNTADQIHELRDICTDLVQYRNGFDHAWTAKKEAFHDIDEKGIGFQKRLEEIVKNMELNHIF